MHIPSIRCRRVCVVSFLTPQACEIGGKDVHDYAINDPELTLTHRNAHIAVAIPIVGCILTFAFPLYVSFVPEVVDR